MAVQESLPFAATFFSDTDVTVRYKTQQDCITGYPLDSRMMKFSDKALKLIGRKLLSSMEASSDQDSSTSTRNSVLTDNALTAHERAQSLGLRAKSSLQKASVLPFRNSTEND